MRKLIFTALLVAAALPGGAAAARPMSGYTLRPTEIVSGPDDDYPTIRGLGPDAGITVYGCLSDWSWCDVSYRYDRGWVSGEDIAISYGGHRRPLSPYLGIGILSFVFGSYWDEHYRGRPFYAERTRWQQDYTQHYRPEWGPRPQAGVGMRGNPANPYQGAGGPSAHQINPGPGNRQGNQGEHKPSRVAPAWQAAPAGRMAPQPVAPHAPSEPQRQMGSVPHPAGPPARPQGGGRPEGHDGPDRKQRG